MAYRTSFLGKCLRTVTQPQLVLGRNLSVYTHPQDLSRCMGCASSKVLGIPNTVDLSGTLNTSLVSPMTIMKRTLVKHSLISSSASSILMGLGDALGIESVIFGDTLDAGEIDSGIFFQKRTFQPSLLVRKRRHGFLARLRHKDGRKILNRRRLKGRKRLAS